VVSSFEDDLLPRDNSEDARKAELDAYWNALCPEIDCPESWSVFRLTIEIYVIEDWDHKSKSLKVLHLSTVLYV
jgi:hypothetical protein